jgi:hypothetical protein
MADVLGRRYNGKLLRCRMKPAHGTKIALTAWAFLVAIYAAWALISWVHQGQPVGFWIILLAIGFMGLLILGAIFGLMAFWRARIAFWGAFVGLWCGFWHGLRSPRKPRPELLRYCTRCDAVEERMFYARGSWLAFIVLCCLFLIPGIIYFVWMRSTEHFGCQKCGSPDIVPLDSPVARRALETQGARI